MDTAPFHRGRRLRRTPGLRALVRENFLRAEDLVMPYFVAEAAADFEKPIAAMPGVAQLGLGTLEKQVAAAVRRGLGAVILFGIPEKKDAKGSGAWAADGAVQKAVSLLKDRFPGLTVITDVCLCEYTSHGHCGVVRKGDKTGRVVNDETLELLARTALSHVDAGADVVAPSDMMDGRVAAIRAALDAAGHAETPVMSYAVKYASSFYGPFREAAESAPAFGDRRTYQMDPANSREAMREAAADAFEGADILMVKPAGPCLDIIRMVRDNFDAPVAAYQVSGEYSMLKAAALNGWTDEKATALESLLAIKRAGADLIITYYAAQALEWMNG
ncbi:MAG: porphobilinogen synthase [Thermodesulfobacteriota bacterium]